MDFGAGKQIEVFVRPAAEAAARRSERKATLQIIYKIVPVSLVGLFLAELFVMYLLEFLGIGWGWATNLLDATLLTALALPGLYLVVVRPVGRLAAALAMATAETRFRAVVEAASDGIVVSDANGRIVFVNRAALRILGYSSEELQGQEVMLIIPQEDRERHRAGFDRYLATGRGHVPGARPVEMSARCKDGGRIPIELSLNDATLQEDGLLVAVLRDLRQTQRVGLYEALLPVCCLCGRIRDNGGTTPDQSRWEALDDYVRLHASASFTHTYCPPCLAKSRRDLGLPPTGS